MGNQHTRGRSGRPPARSNGQSTERATIPADVSGTGLGTESRHDASAPAPPALRCRRNSEAMIWRTCGGAFVLARTSRGSSTSELATTHRRPMPKLLSFVPARSTALRGGEGNAPSKAATGPPHSGVSRATQLEGIRGKSGVRRAKAHRNPPRTPRTAKHKAPRRSVITPHHRQCAGGNPRLHTVPWSSSRPRAAAEPNPSPHDIRPHEESEGPRTGTTQCTSTSAPRSGPPELLFHVKRPVSRRRAEIERRAIPGEIGSHDQARFLRAAGPTLRSLVPN